MARKFDRKLILEDGETYYGYGFGANINRVCELVFDTSMIGYQEIVSDPTYIDQAVVLTYPVIGNYGINADDFESRTASVGMIICREYNENNPSNFRSIETLAEYMEENGIPGIYGMDTRKLCKRIREKGTCKVLITDSETPIQEGLTVLANTSLRTDLVSLVSSKKVWYSRTQNARYNVVEVDCGMRRSLLRAMNERGCNVTIVPFTTGVEEIIKMKPDGIFLSDGPGNPNDVPEIVDLVRTLRGRIPIFGVGLGGQIIAMAYGAKIEKMRCGHRGCNHPIRDEVTGKIEIVTQNHGYAISEDGLSETGLQVSYRNVLDGSIEGICCNSDSVLGVLYHSDISLFDRFVTNMKECKKNA